MTKIHPISDDITQVVQATSTADDRLARIMDDYLVSLENRTPLDLNGLAAKYPEFAEEIRSMAASLDLLHNATRQMRPAADATPAVVAKRLGDFEIGREIGRGGMGVVYEARQLSLQRQVALKVLPFAAMWDQKQIARFRNEALAAAQLHHPHIVPVFAVGQERGVHFYAMQYIDGRSLDQMVSELRRENDADAVDAAKTQTAASTVLGCTTQGNGDRVGEFSGRYSRDRGAQCRAIAELGRQAAEALHHAHEYGIVHRDIKPSNLMIDSQAKLWITDFGLARVQNNPGVTMTGDVVGTLRYMSPEQAAGQQSLVDTRTDIYGLGATLYELLTLRPAFPGEDRHQVLRDIEAKDPTPPRSINHSIPVDLETIVLQAMSKSRESRYSTAHALAEDLQRFLDGKPTLARRPTIADRTAKWMRRHRGMVAMTATFLVMMTLGSSFAALKISLEQERTEIALADAQRNLARAEEHFAQARRVVDRFGIQLADQLRETPGTERLRQHLLVETLQYYRGFAEHIADDPDVQDQLAMTHLKTGVVTAKLGASRKAMAEYQLAQQLLQQLIEQDPNNEELRSQLALARNNMALLFAAAGDAESARREYDLAITAQRRLTADSPDNLAHATHLAESQLNLGTLLGQTDETQAAIEVLNQGVDTLLRANRADPESVDHVRSLAMAYNNLGYVQREVDTDQAGRSTGKAVELLERVCRDPLVRSECVADLALCYSNLAAIQGNADRTAAAIASYERAAALRESLARKSPGIVRYRSELAANLNNLALLQIRDGDATAASDAFSRANLLFAELLEDYPGEAAFASGWAALLNNQGLALAEIGRHEEAIPAYGQATAVQQRVWQQLGDSSSARNALSRIHYNYGRSLRQLGRSAEAVRQALSRRALWPGDGERLFGVAVELAQISASENATDDKQEDKQLEKEVIATLAAALKAGYLPQIALGEDPRFRRWREHPQFQKLTEPANEEIVSTVSQRRALQ